MNDPAILESPPHNAAKEPNATVQLAITALACVLAAVAWWYSASRRPPTEMAAIAPAAAEVIGAGRLRVRADAPFASRLHFDEANERLQAVPLLRATGRVIASLRRSDEGLVWQFASVELLTLWADWERSLVDVEFAREMVGNTQELTAVRIAAQELLVERLAKLVEAGSESERELAAAAAGLGQLRIEQRRQEREAEVALAVALRTEASLHRQLQQQGLDPSSLQVAPARGREVDFVVAEVPEAKASRLKPGISAELRFLALPGLILQARSAALAPCILPDRRIMLVQFQVDEPDRRLLPGMFAEIALGTEPTSLVMVSAAAVVHHRGTDYVVVARGDGELAILRVEAGAAVDGMVPIRNGLDAGERVVTEGAILLKPLFAGALAQAAGGR